MKDKNLIIQPVDNSSYNLAKCYLYEGHFSPHMATLTQVLAKAMGHQVVNIILSKN